MKQAILLTQSSAEILHAVYPNSTLRRISEHVELTAEVTGTVDFEAHQALFQQADYLFSTWGMPAFTPEEIGRLFPRLQAVFYGAGTVQDFAQPFLAKGVRVFSAAKANAVPVAEYTVSQILLAGKGMFQAMRLYKQQGFAAARQYTETLPGNYNMTVGIAGVGAIGRKIIELLAPYRLRILAFDPFLPPAEAEKLGITLCDLPTLFSESQIISNHLANNAQTRGIFDYALFARMKQNAVFINTGRGAQVIEADLARAMEEEPGRTALLDVTWPEPCEGDHPFLRLPNVLLTPHIAGSLSRERERMGEYMLQALLDVQNGRPCEYEVTPDMLATMA